MGRTSRSNPTKSSWDPEFDNESEGGDPEGGDTARGSIIVDEEDRTPSLDIESQNGESEEDTTSDGDVEDEDTTDGNML
jgi:hypothetical protein